MKRGFTLLESIIVISLLGLVGLSFAYLYTTAQRFTIQSVDFTSNQNDAAFALEHIKRHLTVATAVATPAAGASETQLTFRWRPRAGQLERQSDYTLSGTNLQVVETTFNENGSVEGVAPAEPVARGIQSITFTRGAAGTSAAGTISIDVTAQRTPGAEGKTRKMRLQTNISPRGLFQ